MSLARDCLAWIRRVIGRPERPTFAGLLDQAIEKPFVAFSARALELAMLLEQRANPNYETPNPKQPAHAGENR